MSIEDVLTGSERAHVEHGDALEVLKRIPDNSVDSWVTDPPSGISFMGADWDDDKGGSDEWIDWFEDIAAATFRVLKPGAYGAVWAIPRTSHWTGMALERAGFQIVDQFDHLFGSGMPHSKNASKAIDEYDFRRWLHETPGELELERKCKRRVKELRKLGRGKLARALRKRVHGMQLARAGLVRQVVRSYRAGGNAGTPIDEKGGTYGVAVENSDAVELQETIGATERSRKWDGYGTGIRPAREVWWIVRKPLDGTLAKNLLKWGTGALHIDAGRIPRGYEERPASWRRSGHSANPDAEKIAAPPGEGIALNPNGGWPANALFSHAEECVGDECVDGCPVKGLGEQSGVSLSSDSPRKADNFNVGIQYEFTRVSKGHSDSGTATRFFNVFHPLFLYVAKPSTAERDRGLDGFPTLTGGEATNRHDDSDGVNNPRAGAGRNGGRKNVHATVKGEALMAHLIKLTTPEGGTVLDTTAGSGSTGVAAVQNGFRFIGIELNNRETDDSGRPAYYVDVARARIAHVTGQRFVPEVVELEKPKQPGLFDEVGT